MEKVGGQQIRDASRVHEEERIVEDGAEKQVELVLAAPETL
jgi:hypothetical protein